MISLHCKHQIAFAKKIGKRSRTDRFRSGGVSHVADGNYSLRSKNMLFRLRSEIKEAAPQREKLCVPVVLLVKSERPK